MNQANELAFSSMKLKTSNRQFLSGAIIFFYLIPLLFFASYSIGLMSHHKSWSILSLGLLLISFGSLTLILMVYYWELSLKEQFQEEQAVQSRQLVSYTDKENKVTSLDPTLAFTYPSNNEMPSLKDDLKELSFLETALKESQEEQKHLQESLQLKCEELERIEEDNKQLAAKTQQTLQDFADYKLFSEEQLKQKQLQITMLQQMMEDQRGEMEKRQDQIYQLDTKVHDLSYEIKTLLYLHEAESTQAKDEEAYQTKINGSFHESDEETQLYTALSTSQSSSAEKPIKTAAEASTLLKKCINMAQKLTGANYYSNEASRYREFSSSNYAIDQRRLFDSLRNETAGLIVVYSQKDHKLLFANQQSKILLGWSPDKFVSDFSQIIQEASADWKRGINMLASSPEAQTRLLAKNKNGQEVLLSCHLSYIPSGLFKNYVIGVLYPT